MDNKVHQDLTTVAVTLETSLKLLEEQDKEKLTPDQRGFINLSKAYLYLYYEYYIPAETEEEEIIDGGSNTISESKQENSAEGE